MAMASFAAATRHTTFSIVDHCRGSLHFSLRTKTSLTAKRRRLTLRASSASDGAQLNEKRKEEEEQRQKVSQRMQILSDSMVLPDNFLSQLPNDLQRDLKDAAFALASGPVQRECGELAGETLMQLSQAWEKGDTQAATLAAEKLQYVLPGELSSRNAIGNRLIGAGRRFASMGTYAQGELQKIAKALNGAGDALHTSDVFEPIERPILSTTRVYKFGELQVELTAQKCFVGGLIAFGFGVLSWGLSSSLQNIPESTSQYSNDNATQLATSLKGAVLLLGYGCTLLSGVALIGLLGLGFQLSTKQDTSS